MNPNTSKKSPRRRRLAARPVWLLMCWCVWGAAACSSEPDPASKDNNWMLTDPNDQGGKDMPEGVDLSERRDMPEGVDLAELDMPVDMPEGVDMAPDMQTIEDMGPSRDALSGELLAAGDWLAFIPLPALGEGAVGVMLKMAFTLGGQVTVYIEGSRAGKWQILDNGSLYIYELTKVKPDDFDQLFLDPIKRDGVITGLKVRDPNNPDTPVLEQRWEGQRPAVSIDDVKGRWQSKTGFPGENGQTVYLGLRVDDQRTIEYGVVNQGNFAAFATESGQTMTFADGRTFWHFNPPTRNVEIPALAGQILRTASGNLRVFSPVEDKPNDRFFAVELEPVDQFKP